MSVTINDIHAAETFTEPDELVINDRNLDHTAQCPYVIGQIDDDLQRIPTNKFYGPGQYPYALASGVHVFRLSTAGVLYGQNLTQMFCNPSTTFQITVNGNNYLQMSSAFLWTTFYYTLRSSPVGAGIYVYCDGFVEYSMARLKDNITPIPPNVAKKPLIPRQYTQNAKPRLGFVVEESPPEIVVSMVNEEGKDEKGIDLMALCALQQAKIDELDKRILALEGKIK